MRSLPTAITDALAAGRLVARDLAWFTARERDDGDPVSLGLWNGLETVSISVVDVLTGSSADRTFYGAGGLLSIADVDLSADMTIREVEIVLSQSDDNVEQLIRGYDPRLAPVQIYRLLLDPDTHLAVAAARCRFFGYVDKVSIVTPAVGEKGSVRIRAASQLQELTRASTETRSDESQQERSDGDRFYRWTPQMPKLKVPWGREDKVRDIDKKKKKKKK